MRIPGSEGRTVEDRDCKVTCACGAEVMTLRPGQALALRKPGRSMSVTCSKCGKANKVQLSEEVASG